MGAPKELLAQGLHSISDVLLGVKALAVAAPVQLGKRHNAPTDQLALAEDVELIHDLDQLLLIQHSLSLRAYISQSANLKTSQNV